MSADSSGRAQSAPGDMSGCLIAGKTREILRTQPRANRGGRTLSRALEEVISRTATESVVHPHEITSGEGLTFEQCPREIHSYWLTLEGGSLQMSEVFCHLVHSRYR
jgi:hypothetical protein